MYHIKTLIENIETSWKPILLDLYNLHNPYFQKLEDFLNQEYDNFNGLSEIYPPHNLIFNAFNQSNFEDTKIIIIGQDPYHGPGQAQGLCFSVPDNIKQPPSLKRIFTEIQNDLSIDPPKSGDLTRWAKQGVLLLNTALTVRQSKPTSHSKIWDKFTDILLSCISEKLDNIIFMLWGNHAKKYKKFIDINKHHFLEAKHPSPLGSNSGGWFGCQHFSKSNALLNKLNKSQVNW